MLRLLHDSHQHVVDDHHDDVVLNESLLTPKSFQLSLTAPRCPPYYTAQRCLMIGRRPRPDKHPYYLTRHQSNNNSQHNDSHSVRKTWDDFDPHHEYLMHRYIFQSTSNKGHHHKNRLLAMKRRQHSNGSEIIILITRPLEVWKKYLPSRLPMDSVDLIFCETVRLGGCKTP
jgi:hypothetical protein